MLPLILYPGDTMGKGQQMNGSSTVALCDHFYWFTSVACCICTVDMLAQRLHSGLGTANSGMETKHNLQGALNLFLPGSQWTKPFLIRQALVVGRSTRRTLPFDEHPCMFLAKPGFGVGDQGQGLVAPRHSSRACTAATWSGKCSVRRFLLRFWRKMDPTGLSFNDANSLI